MDRPQQESTRIRESQTESQTESQQEGQQENQQEGQQEGQQLNPSILKKYRTLMCNYLKTEDKIPIDFIYNATNNSIEEVWKKKKCLKLPLVKKPGNLEENSKAADLHSYKAINMDKWQFRDKLERYPDKFALTFPCQNHLKIIIKNFPNAVQESYKMGVPIECWFLQVIQTEFIEEDAVHGDDNPDKIFQQVTGKTYSSSILSIF